jgi:hypothetical protein
MSILNEAKFAAEVGVAVTERFAPAIAASKHLVEEVLGDIFKKPQTLSEALPRINEALAGRAVGSSGEVLDHMPTIMQSVAKSDRLANVKVTNVLGTGANELVLATESKTALKLGVENLPRPIAHPAFDAPVLEHGNLGKGVRYYVQPIGQTEGVTDKHVVSVVKRIRANGFLEDDIWDVGGTRKGQVALFGKGQKPLLVDQGSAVPRYGTTYENGRLLPHEIQQSNLVEMREFLQERGISLKTQLATSVRNPLQMEGRSLSTRVDDWQITDTVKDYMKMTGRTPTMWQTWTDNEVMFALKSLGFGK